MSDFKKRWDTFYNSVDDVAKTLKLYPISGGVGEVQVGMPLSKEVSQPAGMFSAPALFGLADIAATWLAMYQVADGVFPLAVGSSVNVVSNAKSGNAIARAKIVRAGSTIIVTDTTVHSDVDDSIIAKVITTYSVPRPRK